MKKQQKFKIRDIEPNDITEVYKMLVSLIKHEGLEEKFKLTKERMRDAFFGENKDWFCLVVQDEEDKKLKGFLIYSFSNINRAFHLSSLIHIDHLYIEPNYRSKRAGENLISELKSRAQINGANRVEVWCMASNEGGNKFYKKLGAECVILL